ncbi:hypothetical protein AB0E55_12815 [Amycolatopsis keratiniphila]|uniref:hypothetical protein n=1 Tax=Amycolatopsis keratiniphila TaxID=129921 RepID=UPI0033C3B59B
MRQWGFVYLADGCDPTRDVSRVDSGNCLTVLIGVGRVEQVVAAARVIEAVGSEVPVGSVMYGAEATEQLHDLFGG